MLSDFGSDSQATDWLSALYMASEGRRGQIRAREDRTRLGFCSEGHVWRGLTKALDLSKTGEVVVHLVHF